MSDTEDDEVVELAQLKLQLAGAEVAFVRTGANQSVQQQPQQQQQQPVTETLANRYYRCRNLTWTRQSNTTPTRSIGPGGRTNKRTASDNLIPVPVGYVCHICGEKGHHIRNCTKQWDNNKRRKKTLQTIMPRAKRPNDDCLIKEETDNLTAALKHTARKTMSPVAQGIFDILGSSFVELENLFRCPTCQLLFEDSVALPCCGKTFCRRCGGLDDLIRCPECHVTHSQVPPNTVVNRLVDKVLRRPGTTRPAVAIAPGTIRQVPTKPGDVVPLGTRLIISKP